MAYAGELPWHGLGTKVPNDLSTDQMLEASGLNWSHKVKQNTLIVRLQSTYYSPMSCTTHSPFSRQATPFLLSPVMNCLHLNSSLR